LQLGETGNIRYKTKLGFQTELLKVGMNILAATRFGFLDSLQHFVAMEDNINLKADRGNSVTFGM
jgi:hypothetical protein